METMFIDKSESTLMNNKLVPNLNLKKTHFIKKNLLLHEAF